MEKKIGIGKGIFELNEKFINTLFRQKNNLSSSDMRNNNFEILKFGNNCYYCDLGGGNSNYEDDEEEEYISEEEKEEICKSCREKDEEFEKFSLRNNKSISYDGKTIYLNAELKRHLNKLNKNLSHLIKREVVGKDLIECKSFSDSMNLARKSDKVYLAPSIKKTKKEGRKTIEKLVSIDTLTTETVTKVLRVFLFTWRTEMDLRYVKDEELKEAIEFLENSKYKEVFFAKDWEEIRKESIENLKSSILEKYEDRMRAIKKLAEYKKDYETAIEEDKKIEKGKWVVINKKSLYHQYWNTNESVLFFDGEIEYIKMRAEKKGFQVCFKEPNILELLEIANKIGGTFLLNICNESNKIKIPGWDKVYCGYSKGIVTVSGNSGNGSDGNFRYHHKQEIDFNLTVEEFIELGFKINPKVFGKFIIKK